MYSSCRLLLQTTVFLFSAPFFYQKRIWLDSQTIFQTHPLFWLLPLLAPLLASLTVKHFSCKWEMGWCGTTAMLTTTVSQRPTRRPPSSPRPRCSCAPRSFLLRFTAAERRPSFAWRPSRPRCSLPKIRVFAEESERATHWAVFSIGHSVSATRSLEMW